MTGLVNAGQNLSRFDRDAELDSPERFDLRCQLERCAGRAQRIILVSRRDPEHGHHLVPGALLDRRAMLLEHRAHSSKAARGGAVQALQVGVSGRGKICDEDCDGLPALLGLRLLVQAPHRRR